MRRRCPARCSWRVACWARCWVVARRLDERAAFGGCLRFLGWATLVGVPVAFVQRFADPTGVVFLPAMFVGSMMLMLGYGPLFASLQDLAPLRLRSTLTAAMILGMTLLGTSCGNLLVGALADRFRATGVIVSHHPRGRMDDAAVAAGLSPCLFGASGFASRRDAGRPGRVHPFA